MTTLNFITAEERDAINKENIAKGGYIDQFEPGTCFYMPWLNNPEGENEYVNFSKNYLSKHYWNDWANLRPPLQIILPQRYPWVVDSGSTNGNGWSVNIEDGLLPSETNRNPKLTAFPSILVPARDNRPEYHGWLAKGILKPC